MAKMSRLPPLLAALPPRLATAPIDATARNRIRDAQPWRKWYKTARWQKLRWRVLVRDRFTCQWPGCGKIEADTSKLHADHTVKHGGVEERFFDEEGIKTLCQHCHNSRKQAEERAAQAGRG